MSYYRVSVDLKDGRREMFESIWNPKIVDGGLELGHENCFVWISCSNIDRWDATKMLPTPELDPLQKGP